MNPTKVGRSASWKISIKQNLEHEMADYLC